MFLPGGRTGRVGLRHLAVSFIPIRHTLIHIAGNGDMITTPRESNNWKLIPADLYKYSIPTAAVARLHQIINAGVRVHGVIIADDEHRT